MIVPAALLGACVAPAGDAPKAVGALTVRGEVPYGFADGAAAKRQADAICGPKGVKSSIYDRYDAGAWIFVEGCA